MTTIAQALNGTLALISIGRDIYQAIVNTMDAVEAGNHKDGQSKKAWVLSYAKSIIQEAGKNWDEWAKYVSDFIDAAKSIYNSLKGIFK